LFAINNKKIGKAVAFVELLLDFVFVELSWSGSQGERPDEFKIH
jgi:hypothetical protein